MTKLDGKRVLIVATDGFEQSELTSPRDRLREEGASVDIASFKTGSIRGWKDKDWGESAEATMTVDAVDVEDYDALVLPGGQINPDVLRTDARVVRLVQEFVDAGKPVAAICHAPWLLIEADVVDGRSVTGYHSIRTDLLNAGAQVLDQPVVVDGTLITSRSPEDLDAFNSAISDALSQSSAAAA